jgi:hypothetical protein
MSARRSDVDSASAAAARTAAEQDLALVHVRAQLEQLQDTFKS